MRCSRAHTGVVMRVQRDPEGFLVVQSLHWEGRASMRWGDLARVPQSTVGWAGGPAERQPGDERQGPNRPRREVRAAAMEMSYTQGRANEGIY